MGAFARMRSDQRGVQPAKTLDSWEGEADVAPPLAKGPGFGKRIPSDREFERRFPPELVKTPNKKSA